MLIYDIIPPQNIKKKTKRSRKALAFLVILFLISQLFAGAGIVFFSSVKQAKAAGTTYYVDATNGNDDDNGTSPETAWKTIGKVNASSFNAGDSILFKRGETWTTGTLTPASSGSAGDPIIFSDYGTGDKPKINPSGAYAVNTNNKSNLSFYNIRFEGNGIYIDSGAGIHFEGCSTNRQVRGQGATATLNRCDIKPTTFERGAYFSDGGTFTLNYCIITGAQREGIILTGATALIVNNCVIEANNNGIAPEGTNVVTVKNSIIVGNRTYGFFVGSGATINYDYNLISGNGTSIAANVGGTGTKNDGGHNLINYHPYINSYFNNNAYFSITSDDSWSQYWADLAGALPSTVKCTFFLNTHNASSSLSQLQALVSAGHEIAAHGHSHTIMTTTTAFQVSSTNTNPTVNVDIANSQIILYCDEAERRVTVDWSQEDKTISDLKTAVLGKGWTITNPSVVSDALKLASLADSGGPQECPYTTNLDRVAPNYAFFREEIQDSADWIATNLGQTPNALAYPWGLSDAEVWAYLKDISTLKGARAARGTSGEPLESITNIYDIVMLSLATLKGDGTEEAIRANARHFCNYGRSTGRLMTILTHSASELTPTQVGWFVDEAMTCGGQFKTFGQIISEIREGHSTTDGYNYTKTYPDVSDYRLQSTSPCIDAGTDVGLTEDYAGNPIYGAPDIGAYEYQPLEAGVTVSATVAETAELMVYGTTTGVSINGATTSIVTTTSTVPLGQLSTFENSVGAQILNMSTNAGGGYTVTIKYDHKLWSSSNTSTDIDDHTGSNATPTVFSSYGTEAFGYTTEDFSLSDAGEGPSRFSGGKWAGFSTDAYEVAYHTGPVSATTTKIGFQAGISVLTPAADDYGCQVTYTMTGTF